MSRPAHGLLVALDDWLADSPPPVLPDDSAGRFQQLRIWQRSLNDGGWLGFGWPAEHGGQPGSWADQAAVYSHLALRGAPLPVGIIGLQTVGPALVQHGTDEQRRRYLPRILNGQDIWCQGFSEPDAGSDLASLRTTATACDGGLIVNGQKVWTSWAQYADLCAALVRTGAAADRHRGLSYLVVPMSAAGVRVRPIEQMTGESEFNEVFFRDVHVSRDNLIGPEGSGWRVALSTLDYERATYAISKHAELRMAFERLLDLAPADAAIPARELGWAEIGLQALDALARAAGSDLENGDVGSRSAIYKLLTSQLEQDVSKHALAITEATPAAWAAGSAARQLAHQQYLASRSATIHGGTAQILRGVIAQNTLGLPRDR